ncbi:MAG: CPBP family intramembrane glutamic endopeptidase [Candidatus Omnitrophota bacterium]
MNLVEFQILIIHHSSFIIVFRLIHSIMKIPVFWRVIVVLIVSTLAACLLHPLFYAASAVSGLDAPIKIFRRLWEICIVLGLMLARRQIGLQHPGKVGLRVSKDGIRNLLAGLIVAACFLFSLSGLYLFIGAWTYSLLFSFSYLQQKIIEGLATGAAVALVEEYIFRGLIFRSLSRRWGWIMGGGVSSAIFSSLHFLSGKGGTLENPNSWQAGFQLCGQLLHEMISTFKLFPEAAGLFLVGFILCYAAQRTGTLWLSVGLHGGWVCFFVMRKALFETAPLWDSFWIGGNRIYNGVIPILGMLVIFPIVHYLRQWKIVRGEEMAEE